MSSDLSKQANIGKTSEAKLIQVGINSFAELQAIGSEQAFIRLQTIDPGTCLCMLYGLEGAIQGISSGKLSNDKKRELQDLYKMMQIKGKQ